MSTPDPQEAPEPQEESNLAVMEVAATDATETEYDGPRCTKCEAPMAADQMVCRCCGFYPSLGITVDLDAEWEAAMSPELAAPTASKTALEEFASAMPPWAWPVIGTNVGILAVATAGRFLLPSEAVLFDYWGTLQLISGLALVVALHITCFVMTASSDNDMGIFDLVVSPLKAWIRTFKRLPERLWLVVGASNGVTMALAAALIIGGIPWHRLWDWGIEAPMKTSLVDAIASAAAKGPSEEKPIEDAVVDFAGQAMPGDAQPKKPKEPKEPAPRIKTDCLIIGFKMNEYDALTEVLIATETSGRLLYAGKLVPELPAEEKLALHAKLMRSRTGTPLVKTGQVATWVQPRFPCRISYTEQATNGRLLEMEWEELLPELQLPW
jgi:hypothetical protein